MKKHINKLFLICSMMMPTIVLASSEDSYDTVGAKALIICFGLISIFTIILPIRNLFKEKRNTAITLYIITIVLFILAMSNASDYAPIYIFLNIFGMIALKIVSKVTKKPLIKSLNKKQERIEKSDMIVYEQNKNTKIICEKCGNELEINDKFCPKCGTAASYTSKVKTLAKIS